MQQLDSELLALWHNAHVAMLSISKISEDTLPQIKPWNQNINRHMLKSMSSNVLLDSFLSLSALGLL